MKDHKVVISCRNVAVEYAVSRQIFSRNSYFALKDVSFDLYAGESLGVIGRNGAGKSSLLRLLSGLILPDKGEVVNYGVKPALMALQVGFDEQLTGRENALLSGMLLGFSRDQVNSQLGSIISFAELGNFIDAPVSSYSSGMKARLGFSICHTLEPEVLLIDEVLGVGDIDFQEKSAAVMHEKIRSDHTVVLVSHHGEMIRQLCNRALWIEDGIVRMEGDPEEVVLAYEDYIRANKRIG